MKWRRVFVRASQIAGLLGVALLGASSCASLGRTATGARLERVEASPHYADGEFHNPQPIVNDVWGALTAICDPSPSLVPNAPLAFAVNA